MVKTADMWRYTGTVELGHYHGGDINEEKTWTTLTAVTPSSAQGWDFELEDGCKLQRCFGEMEVEVRTIWLDEVANWGR